MKYCKKCTMPDTRPGITFDENGVCSACNHYAHRKDVDWDARWKEFEAMCDKYRGCNGPGGYDCAVAVSGGKDSHFQVYMLKEVMRMNPILFSVEDNFPMTEAGKHNLKNISEEFGCTIISCKPNIKAQKIEETAKRKIVDEERELERVKKEVSLFKNRMMSIYREHLSLIGMLPEDEAASETEGNETPAAEPEAAPSAAEEPSRPAAESTVPAAAPAASEAPAPIAVPKAPDTVAYEQTVAAFRMNIPILDEEGTEPAAEPAAAVPKPSSRFSDLKFGENYDISQDTDEEPGFFKKKRSER